MNINKATLAGNLTRAVELKSMPNGMYVASFSLACNRTYKDKDGKKVEAVEFVNCVAYGKTAEILGQYCVKGQNMYVEGRLQTRNWEDKQTGAKMYRTEVIVNEFQFGQKPNGSPRREQPEDSNNGFGEDAFEPTPKAQTSSRGNDIAYPVDEINPDDIPF